MEIVFHVFISEKWVMRHEEDFDRLHAVLCEMLGFHVLSRLRYARSTKTLFDC